MSTYARWVLWVGVPNDRIGAVNKLGDSILGHLDAGGSYPVGEHRLTNIAMHGEGVGVGVEVAVLDWSVEIGDDNVLQKDVFRSARRLTPEVHEVFRKLGIRAPVRVYYHIDLGG